MLFPKALALICIMAKRAFDIVFGVLGLIVLMPVFVLIGILIKLDSLGPVFYKGLRAGRFGQPIQIYKFRTMVPNMEKPGGDTTALRDPRITRVGTVLRRYKIDELPQLLNIIKGEMSFVGPRPELFAYTDRYSSIERCILEVRPGVTDLSSMEFGSLDECVGPIDADKVFEETILPRKNKLRMKYVQEQSFLLDMRIIARTIWIIWSKVAGDLKIRHRVNIP